MRRSVLVIALIAALSLLALACGSTGDPEPAAAVAPTAAPTSVPTAMPEPTQPPEDTPTPEPTQQVASLLPPSPDRKAPELAGLDGWLNTEPFTLADKRGQVVLIDFWTYTCVNCIRTLPYIKEWHDKYADKGLVILGVHAPEFEFEKLPENVAMARDDHGLEYPIAQDNDHQTWLGLREPVLARQVPDRQGRRDTLQPLRRGRVRRNRGAHTRPPRRGGRRPGDRVDKRRARARG